jgi:2-(1,2-epoxy-1,2-dihydrophenyl)acetyl-CoA isomerase
MTSQPQEIATGTTDLLARREDRTLILTMNRPKKRNALSTDMLVAMADQLAKAEADDDSATGAFCAGGDVEAMATSAVADDGHAGPRLVQWQRRLQNATAGRLFAMPKPTIAALNGPAAGAGLSLAMV